MDQSSVIYRGVTVVETASVASLNDFRSSKSELLSLSTELMHAKRRSILELDLSEEYRVCTSPGWNEDNVMAWMSSHNLAIDVIERTLGNVHIMRDMELLVVQFKNAFLYDAVSVSLKNFVLSRQSVRYSLSENQRTKHKFPTRVAQPPGGSISGPVEEKKEASPIQRTVMGKVASDLQSFISKLLSKSFRCDDKSIPEKCYDLLFYAALFFPQSGQVKMSWYREMILRAGSFMKTPLLFRSEEGSGQRLSQTRRFSSIKNSTIDEEQIMSNLETYRRATLLSIYLHGALVNRVPSKQDLLSSLHDTGDVQKRLSPTQFIHLILYDLRCEQLPSFLQPQFALSSHAKPFPKSEDTDLILQSLHDAVEAVVSFQALRRHGIEKFYIEDSKSVGRSSILELNADFEVALKVTVLRQQDAYMR